MTCEKSPPRDFGAEVLENRRLDGATFLMTLRCPEIAGAAEPGQFVLIRPGTGHDPFLGRPLAVAGAAGDGFKVIVRIAGRGTALLASRREGDLLVVRGPSGKGFWSSRGGAPLPEKIILAGGSVGAAPLVFAAARLAPSRVERMVFGFAGRGWEGLARLLEETLPDARLYSDDGTLGNKGTVLSGLPLDIPGGAEIWACGPGGMLKALAAKYPGRGGEIRVSLEARMACGMGGCLGCTVPTVTGSARVCAEGPVFTAGEVKWDELPCL